jgi:hypothetical protein
MRYISVFLLLHSISLAAVAQFGGSHSIHVKVLFGQSDLVGDTFYRIHETDSIQIEELKFYISGIELWNNNKKVWTQQNSFHLIDISNPASMKVDLNIPPALQYNQLRFAIGVDSATSTAGALGGDLDPTRGMYWSWQSGYINVKLEGIVNLSRTRHNRFQFHLGGYQYPFNALQQVVLPLQPQQHIPVAFNVKGLMEKIDFGRCSEVMSPCKDAVVLSRQMVKLFSIALP